MDLDTIHTALLLEAPSVGVPLLAKHCTPVLIRRHDKSSKRLLLLYPTIPPAIATLPFGIQIPDGNPVGVRQKINI